MGEGGEKKKKPSLKKRGDCSGHCLKKEGKVSGLKGAFMGHKGGQVLRKNRNRNIEGRL